MSEALKVDKATLRQWAKARRSTLDISALGLVLVSVVAALPEWQSARHVLLYLAFGNEISVEPLAADEAASRQFYAPRCAKGRQLEIYPFVPGETPLVPGPWGIREPDPAFAPPADVGLLDLVLVPSLLLSRDGTRLGYGGGYYDRFLPRLPARCVTVGVAPNALVVPTLPREAWDIPLDIVVTETTIYRPAP